KQVNTLTSNYNAYKVALVQDNFILDIYNKSDNFQLDLDSITRIAIYVVSNNSTGFHTMYLNSIVAASAADIQAPVLITESQTTNIAKQTIAGNVLDLEASEIQLFINSDSEISATASVIGNEFTFNNIILAETTSTIKVRSKNKFNEFSDFSKPITITLEDKIDLQLSLQNASSAGIKPVFITLPIGSQTINEIPTVSQVLLSQNPEFGINLPNGITLQPAELQLLEVSLSEQPQKAITISIPLEDTSYSVAPWIYINGEWTRDGISNVQLTTKSVFDPLLNAKVDMPYLTFSANTLSVFGLFRKDDINNPRIEYIQFDQKEIYANDYINPSPELSIRFSDNQLKDSGIASWIVSIINTVDNSSVQAFTGKLDTPQTLHEVTYKDFTLDSGIYITKITVADAVGNTTIVTTPTFNVSAELDIYNCLNGPNPFNPLTEVTNIQYQLSQSADVSIYIYSISGEMLVKKQFFSGEEGASAGFNNIIWDGRNRFNEVVANGVYITYIIAKVEGKTVVGKVKIAVLK
ncbi:hypothetical protein ACFL2K_05305, partial [Candidatus Margulisiibacteriota bacterium]